jgi:hypothetical protein
VVGHYEHLQVREKAAQEQRAPGKQQRATAAGCLDPHTDAASLQRGRGGERVLAHSSWCVTVLRIREGARRFDTHADLQLSLTS